MFHILTRGLDALTRHEADGSSGSTAADDGKTAMPEAGAADNDQSDPQEGLDDLLKDSAAAKEYIVKLRKENADKRAKGKNTEAELDALRVARHTEKAQREAAKKKEDEEAMRKRGEHEKIIADRDGSIATLTAEKDTLSAQLAEYHKRDAEELTVTLKALTKEEIDLFDMIDEKDIPKRLRLAKSMAAKKRAASAPDNPPSNGFGGGGAQSTGEFIAGIFKTGK